MADNDWLGLFLMFAGMIYMNPELKEQMDKEFENQKRMLEYQNNCEYIEWEQDMGKHIPWCKISGGYCDMWCYKTSQIGGKE